MKTISAQQLLITLTPALFILFVMVLAGLFFQASMGIMTRDMASIANIHPLSGILSNLGVLLWCVAASITGFTAVMLRRVQPKETFWFLLATSLLSTYLLLDDFFLFHESLAPRYVGLDEKIIFAALGIALFIYLITFRRFIIWRTHFGALFLALGFLVISASMDIVFEPWLEQLGDWTYFFEDGAKWLGIAFWCSYCVHTSYQLLARELIVHPLKT